MLYSNGFLVFSVTGENFLFFKMSLQVFTIESNAMCARLMHMLIKENKLEDKVTVIEKLPVDITVEDFQGMNVGQSSSTF